jgi:hypothetical protein
LGGGFGLPVGAWATWWPSACQWVRRWVRAAFASPVGGCLGACVLWLASGWVRGCMRAAFGLPVGGCMHACVRPSARQWVRWLVRVAFGSLVGACVRPCGLRLSSGCVGGCVRPSARQWVRAFYPPHSHMQTHVFLQCPPVPPPVVCVPASLMCAQAPSPA